MLKIFIALLSLNLFQLQSTTDSTFFKKVIFESNGRETFYLCIHVNVNGSEKYIACQSIEVFNMLKRKVHDYLAYREYIYGELIQNNKIEIEKKYYNKSNVYEIAENWQVENVAKKGENYFIQYYFEKRYEHEWFLKHWVKDKKDIAYIIYKLFNWKIRCSTDSKAGELFIKY